MTTAAHADVSIISQSPTFKTENLYETVQVCTPGTQGNGFDLGSAIIGGAIGNNLEGESGGGAAGAIIGGLLGGASTPEKWHTERRVSGTRQIHTGYSILLDVDGRTQRITVSR